MLLELTLTAAEKQAAVSTLSNICYILVLSAAAAGFVWFVEMCKEKGMILRKPYALLTWFLWYKTRPRTRRYISGYLGPAPLSCDSRPLYSSFTTKRPAYYTALYKVLGGCVWCFGFWAAAFIYCLAAPLNLQSWTVLGALFIPYIGLHYIFMELVNNLRK